MYDCVWLCVFYKNDVWLHKQIHSSHVPTNTEQVQEARSCRADGTPRGEGAGGPQQGPGVQAAQSEVLREVLDGA